MSPIPSPCINLVPHLTVSNGSEAVAFYTKAFGAHEEECRFAPDNKRIMYARLTINGSPVAINDCFPECGHTSEDQKPSGFMIHMNVQNADNMWNQALAAGGVPVLPIADQPWGMRYGIIQDPFGHKWSIGAPL